MKLEESYEFKGLTKEEAIKIAENTLKLDREALIILEEKELGKKRLFSILDKERYYIKVQVDPEKIKKNIFRASKVESTVRKLRKFLDEFTKIYEHLDVRYDIFVKGRKVYVDITTKQNSRLIGRNGATLEALQVILNEACTIQSSNVRVYVNVASYKENKERDLLAKAERLIVAIKNGKTDIVLENLNSYERRTLHGFFHEHGILTKSIGVGKERRMIVNPADIDLLEQQEEVEKEEYFKKKKEQDEKRRAKRLRRRKNNNSVKGNHQEEKEILILDDEEQ